MRLQNLDPTSRTMLTESEFAEAFVQHMLREDESLQIAHVGELELHIDDKHRALLGNAWNEYAQTPDELENIIERYGSSIVEAIRRAEEDGGSTNAGRIVPVLKEAAWPIEVKQNAIASGADPNSIPNFVWDDVNEQLVALFAIDSENGIQYLSEENLQSLEIAREDLLEHAMANLLHAVDGIQIQGNPGLYMILAGGTYEASTLLIDDLWSPKNFDVAGQIVVAAPARDAVLVTGNEDEENVAKVRAIAEDMFAKSNYQLCPDLFVRQEDGWLRFEG